jgi:hypothetical protein
MDALFPFTLQFVPNKNEPLRTHPETAFWLTVHISLRAPLPAIVT